MQYKVPKSNPRINHEWKTIKTEQKLTDHKPTVTRADKRKTLITIPKQTYYQKIINFTNDNSFIKITHNPTKQYQKATRTKQNNNNSIIQKNQKWKLINLNPQPPTLRTFIKLHKPNNPIRPIINWHNTPAYNLAKHIVKLLNENIQLPNSFNIRNMNTLIEDLEHTQIDETTSPCSFDITNMYTNIPQDELPQIIQYAFENSHTTYGHLHF
jgi:hypothetical protein